MKVSKSKFLNSDEYFDMIDDDDGYGGYCGYDGMVDFDDGWWWSMMMMDMMDMKHSIHILVCLSTHIICLNEEKLKYQTIEKYTFLVTQHFFFAKR